MKNKPSFHISRLNLLFQRPLVSALFLVSIFCIPLPAIADTSTPVLPTLAETEAAVRAYFIDTPAMIAIAKCESSFRQYNNNGTPLRGSNLYIGVFQISEKIHATTAKNLGLDIYTLDGNLAYAKYLYGQAGTRPWAGCVTTTAPASTEIPPTVAQQSAPILTRNLKIGMTDPQVLTIQQLLNAAGFMIASSGPGSAGKETTTFGSLTRAAVRRFQCDKKIVCTGSETTTGYGFVGPRTRALLVKTAPAQ